MDFRTFHSLVSFCKTITSAFELSELLNKITEGVSRLLNAKGCILRLLEDGILRLKSSYGLPVGREGSMEVDLGYGIAGWVAQNGKPLLVEDVSKMPEDLNVPEMDVQSVICVPLKVGDTIIGTLGLYDKEQSDGTVIPFTIDDLNTVEDFASISALVINKAWIHEKGLLREKDVFDAKQRLETLFESVQSGIVTFDQNYKILSANRLIEQWSGKKAEDIIGKNCIEIFHEDGGICPHCVAKVTFQTGEMNSIAQVKGTSYIELTSYPINDDSGAVVESVVIIRDITDRVRNHEEILHLYKDVSETKEYLESLIDDSADAIVTSDLNGIITSWNRGAEEIYGFTEQEAIGSFLPFIPHFILDKEKEHIEMIKRGETIKRIETIRKRKDGTLFEVSLTLSPIKDTHGNVIGISGIARDISERKHIEKELRKRNDEISRLSFISSTMRETLELDRLLRMILTSVTMGEGLGFNRAILFLIDEKKGVLKGAMGVGPASHEEAGQIWHRLSSDKKTLPDIIRDIETGPLSKDSFLDRLSLGIEISLSEETILTKTVKEKRPFNIQSVNEQPLSDFVLTQQLGTNAYAVVPLISKDKVIGVLWVDNHFNRKPIIEEDLVFLISFSNHVATAIESARLFEQVTLAEQELENIFESISDMVYFVTEDYVVKNINTAVCKKLKKTPHEIIGKKCYEVFHGMNQPWSECPHHKTVETKRASVKEVEDDHLGGTFIISSSPIFDMTGVAIGTVNVVRDITELRNLREKLVKSERMAALGEVAAKVAHEIRNPLVSVGGFARRLEKRLDGNLKEYAVIISHEVKGLEKILNEILSFVKESRLLKEIVNMTWLVDDIISLIQPDLDDRNITIVREFGEPTEIHIDPNRMKEALLNIFTNAIQALHGKGTIFVKTYVDGDSAVIEIQDTGKGMSEEILPYIFDPFFTTKDTGTGLGLTITQRIIEEHNGRVEVESKPHSGSIFKVFIPLQSEIKNSK